MQVVGRVEVDLHAGVVQIHGADPEPGKIACGPKPVRQRCLEQTRCDGPREDHGMPPAITAPRVDVVRVLGRF